MRILSEGVLGDKKDGAFCTYYVEKNDGKKIEGSNLKKYPFVFVAERRKNVGADIDTKITLEGSEPKKSTFKSSNAYIALEFASMGESKAVFLVGEKSDVVKFTSSGVTSVKNTSLEGSPSISRTKKEEGGKTTPKSTVGGSDDFASVGGGGGGIKKKKEPSSERPSGEGAAAADVPPPAKREPLPTDIQKGGTQHEPGLPGNWQKIITLDDPEGDRAGTKYGDPRYYKLKNPDYMGDQLQYGTYVDPDKVKFKDDIKAENKPSFCFKVVADTYDQSAGKGKDAPDFDTTGLEIWSDGSWSGQLPRLTSGKSRNIEGKDLINLRFTFEELWAELVRNKDRVELPDRPTEGPPKPDAPPREGGAVEEPRTDDMSDGGGIEVTIGDRGCCHEPDRLVFSCYREDYIDQGSPNGLNSSDEDKFYLPSPQYTGSVGRYSRGIQKKGGGWRHFIYTADDRVDVFTEGDNLLDYNNPRAISKIRISLQNGSYRQTVDNPQGIAAMLPILRSVVQDVRLFLPQLDACGIGDDRIPGITNFTRWTSGGMRESYDLAVRRRVRQILQGSYRS